MEGVRVLVGLALVLAGCYHPNPATGVPCAPDLECPEGQTCNTLASPPVCVAGGGSGGADAPVAGDGPLVDGRPGPQCTVDSDCASSVATPICDPASHTCRGCVADAECTAGVCHELAGTCVPDAQVVFLSPAPVGTDAGTCTRAMPCASFNYAFLQLSPTRTVVRIGDGSYSDGAHLSITGTEVVLSGEDRDPAGATITSTNPGGVIQLDLGTDAVLEGVTITNGAGDGIFARGQLVVSRVTVSGSGGMGINMSGQGSTTLSLLDSRIATSQLQGVYSTKGNVDLERDYVLGNLGGGIHVQQGGVTIVNTIVAQNGTTSSAIGGIRLDNPLAPSIVHDTIAYNQNSTGSLNAPGLQCNSSLSVTNLIFADNGTLGERPYSSLVAPAHSLFEGSTAPQGMGNRAGSAAFVDVATGDFHILSTSAAIDAAATSAIDDDIDGDVRPYGAGPDMGADEYHP